ncbi:MAG: hypothetical protein GC186_06715 [Rhodobacteraceae bacterium]|nr:hypothetical protein [Paracoccaceae bacterium]
MTAMLIFVAACAGIVALGWIVSKFTGAKTRFLDAWAYAPGETVLWRDDGADVVIVPRLGGAVSMRPVRLHRWAVVATDRRVLLGNKALGGRQMVRYVLETAEVGADAQRLDGGLLTRGFSTLGIAKSVTPHLDLHPPYVALTPQPDLPSSTNVAEVRIYTDSGAGFRLA